MNTVTIFEGADGAGKTTLIEALAPRVKATVFHHGTYPGEMHIARHYLASLKAACDGPVFMDRSWLAEPIYGRAFRNGEDRVGVAARRMLERVALSLGAVVVRCAPSFDVCAEAFARRRALHGEYLDTKAQLRAVYHGYQEDLRTDVPVIDFDYTSQSAPDLWRRIEVVRPKVNDGPGIGRWAPGEVTLLVGDRMNSHGGDLDLPFISFNRGGCSAWLAEALEATEVPERDLYWVNARGLDGVAIKAEFVGMLKPKQVIALGAAARTWCATNRVLHATVPHPQFWKRSKSTAPYPLLGLLQEAL